jgi:antitoxin component YwqK of YwqJK toxin-antitoxin module
MADNFDASIRVLYDDIDYTDDDLYVYDGKPFTGIGFEIEQDGTVVSELEFVQGKLHGMSRGFYSSGQLEEETPYVNGLKHGVEREWFESGVLRREAILEFDVLMRSKVWNEEGKLIHEEERPPDDHLYKLVMARRTAK